MSDIGPSLGLSADHLHAAGQDPVRLPDKGHEAGVAFEAMFVNEIFKIMRKSTPNSQKDFGARMFNEMFDEQIAKHVAEAGLGLQNILTDALGKKTAQDEPTHVDRPEQSPSDLMGDPDR